MLEEVVNTSNSLDELFKENDYDFINTLENNIDEIHLKISEQKNKRNKIIKLVKLSNKDNNSEANQQCNDINNVNLNNSNEIIQLIDSNIKSLYSIEMSLNDLCQSFTDSYVSDILKNGSDSAFDSIKASINTYSSKLSEFNKVFQENNSKIDKFLKDNGCLISESDKNLGNNINNINEFSTQQVSDGNTYLENDIHSDNPYLIVSEKEQKVFLPYKVSEIYDYIKKYPNVYSSFEDVVKKEFILSLSYYTKNPIIARFRETYALIRDREAKSIIEALKYSFDLMFKDELNPTIIAACKTEQQLNDYLTCLEHKNLDNFKHFKIQFYIAPLTTKV